MSWEFFNSKTVKTRKSHRCHLCFLDIPKGTNCTYESGKFDGDFFSRYSHDECLSKWREINEHAYHDEEWMPLNEMAEVDPMNFSQWQKHVGTIYNVLDGDGL